MQQKTTWMRYLTLGLIISLILNSCTDERYEKFGEFHFVNETDHTITYPTISEKFNVGPKSTTVFKETTVGEGREAIRSDYKSPFAYTAQLQIKFGNSKCLVDVKIQDVNSVKDIKNYVAEKLGERKYKFTYTFTEADYNRATTCP